MVSVPYRGYSFFNYIINRRVTRPRLIPVSVPYRGYSFFNGEGEARIRNEWNGFRPLQGLFVF